MTPRKRLALHASDLLARPLAWRAMQASRCRAIDPAASLRILVLEFWQLGDAVLAEPFLRALRRRFPAAELSLLCKDSTRTLLAPSGLVDRFVVADIPWTAFDHKYALSRYRDSGFASLVRQLRAHRYDLTFDARMDLRSNLLTWAIGASRRVGFNAPGARSLLTDRVAVPDGRSHKVDDWLALLEPFSGSAGSAGSADSADSAGDGEVGERVPRLTVTRDERERAASALQALGWWNDRALVAVHPSARQAVRRWPLERFGALVQALARQHDVRVLVIQDPDGYGAELAAIPGVLTTRPTLSELPAQLEICDLFIGNDSGPAHLAAAVGVPVLTIFGPQNSAWYAPVGPSNRVVQLDDVACRPCFDRCSQTENYCLTGIDVARVLGEADLMLAERRSLQTSPASAAGGAIGAPLPV